MIDEHDSGPAVDLDYLEQLGQPAPAMDDNDRHRAGQLPDDPFEGCEPVKVDDGGRTARDGDGLGVEQVAIGDLVDRAIEKMRARADGSETPIPLPWPKVAESLGGGLWPGLHVLVGNTGSGKSQWSLQAALYAARRGTPVLYIGLELGAVDLVARCLAMLADLAGLDRVPRWSGLYLGRDEQLLAQLAERPAVTLRDLPIVFEFGGPMGWPAERLPGAVKALRERWPDLADRPPLVVLDYLQVVGPSPGERVDLRERIGRAAYQGRQVAREQDAAVLLVSSTPRENYARLGGDGKPWEGPPSAVVGMGKESGEIEFAADSVLVLTAEPWRDRDNDGQPRPPHGGTVIHLAGAKVRAGRTFWRELRFDGGSFWEPREGIHTGRPVGWIPISSSKEAAFTVDADGRASLLYATNGRITDERPLRYDGVGESGLRAGLADVLEWSKLDLRPCLAGNPPDQRTGPSGPTGPDRDL